MSSSFSPFCTWCIISLRSFSLFTHINTLHSVAVRPKRTNKIELPFSLLLPSSWLLVAPKSTVICPVSSGFFLFPSALVSWCLSSLWCSKIYTLMPPASTVCQVPSLIQRHTKQTHKPAALPFFVCFIWNHYFFCGAKGWNAVTLTLIGDLILLIQYKYIFPRFTYNHVVQSSLQIKCI